MGLNIYLLEKRSQGNICNMLVTILYSPCSEKKKLESMKS